MNDDLSKSAWKSQDLQAAVFSVDQLHSVARKLDRRSRIRNTLEYAACLLVVVCFVRFIVVFPYPLMRLGSALIIIGTLIIAWQLHVRASSQSAPRELAGLEYHRRQLVRQREALRTVWLWYVAPLVPGVVLFRWGVEIELDASGPFARGMGANMAIAAVFFAIILVNLHGARRLQRQLDRLPRDADNGTS